MEAELQPGATFVFLRKGDAGMNFKFSPEERDIILMVREFCQKEVMPLSAELDEEERFPEETMRKLAEMGLMGISFPEEYGGAGMTYLSYISV